MIPRALTYVEIDLPRCVNTYGVSPCTASLGVTGTKKCFNTPATCQDSANYVDSTVTVRFALNCSYLPDDIDCLPMIQSVDVSPAIVSLGRGLGRRENLNVTFTDRPFSDTKGFDKYLTDRSYDPFKQGTFWGKFRARYPYITGKKVRLIYGFVGQTLAQMEVRHYIADVFSGPGPDGKFVLTAKDPLKALDDDRAQAPVASKGALFADLTNSATSFTLTPAGIGNAEYPTSGYVAIGGNEICSFTRSGDAMTIVRGQYNTTAVTHKAQDRVQLCLLFTGVDPANILNTLMTTYASVDSSYIPLAAWLTETSTFLNRVFTALIAEPTGVQTLIQELIEQAALSVWWDNVNQLVKLRVLRDIPANTAVFSEDNYKNGSLGIKEQPDLRISRVVTYFSQINPLKKLDDTDNYSSMEVTLDLTAETAFGTPAIKIITSRWIPQGGRAIATAINQKQLARYLIPPRNISLTVQRLSVSVPDLGGSYHVDSWCFQDDEGLRDPVPVQVTSLKPDGATIDVEFEEMHFDQSAVTPSNVHDIIIDTNTLDINIRTTHDSLYPTPVNGDIIRFTVQSGTVIGSSSASTPAVDVGTWPVGVTVYVVIKGRIQGRGGAGGHGTLFDTGSFTWSGSTPGQKGGTALKTTTAVYVDDSTGHIWAGGGGGGGGGANGGNGGGGGGGSGTVGGSGGAPSPGGTTGGVGTDTTGGSGGVSSDGAAFGGTGGLPGQDGTNGSGSSNANVGGSKGNAIDGVSNITFGTLSGLTFTAGATGTEDIRGFQIN